MKIIEDMNKRVLIFNPKSKIIEAVICLPIMVGIWFACFTSLIMSFLVAWEETEKGACLNTRKGEERKIK